MKILISCLLFFCTAGAAAQSSISGKVIDRLTGEPVEFATVQQVHNGGLTLTGKDGSFTLPLQGDSAALLVAGIGYQPQRRVCSSKDISITVPLERGVLSLKELVLTSGFVYNNPGTVISKTDLKLRPVQSAQELLRNVPGLFIAQHQGGGKAEQIFLRGFDTDHGTDIKITVDGLPVNMVSHAHGQGYADLHFLIPELVKNIDYGKGPYHKEHGNLATAGYAAFETKSKLERSTIQLERGSFNTSRALAMLQLVNKTKQDAYIASEVQYSDGPFNNPQQFNRFNVQGRYNYRPGQKTALSFTASLLNSRWNAGGQLPQRAVNDGSISRFGQLDGEAGYTGRLNVSARMATELNPNGQLESQLYYSRYHFNLYSNFTFFLNDSINGDQIRQREKRDIWGWQTKYTRRSHAGPVTLVSTVGTGIRHDRTRGSELSHTLQRITLLETIQLGNITETNAWLYADEKISIGRWLINPGIRADWFSFGYRNLLQQNHSQQNRAIVSPALNVQYNLSKKMQLYAKAGRGFHSNDTRVVLNRTARKIVPAADGADLGISWKPLPGLLVNAAVWQLWSQQEFVYVGDEGIVEAGGSSRRMGFDLSMRLQLAKQLFADVNINLAKARATGEPKGNDYIPLAPGFTSSGGLQYQANKGFSGSLRYRFIRNRPANEDGSIVAPGYFVADAALSYTQKKYELGLVAENIFNTRWNEAQFATTSRLKNEAAPVTELHFTPGMPFFIKARLAVFF